MTMGGGSGSGKGASIKGGRETTAKVSPTDQSMPKDNHSEHTPLGFQNWGNTCYANAALQCLLSTALSHALLDPTAVVVFRRYSSNSNLLSKGSGEVDSDSEDDLGDSKKQESVSRKKVKMKEKEERRMHESCKWLTKELTRITRQYTTGSMQPKKYHRGLFGFGASSSSSVVDPGSITKHPNRLSNCLRPYQQEDAHEFLRALLGTLMMNGQNKKLSSLFDGLMESAITCQTCRHTSLTRDRYMDLSLDISHDQIATLPDALAEFTKTEVLDEDNMVMCDKCEEKRQVTKGLRLATAPSILVCHLKRFAYDRFGRLVRLHKHIRFPLRLDIEDHMSLANKSTPPPYELVGVLVHQGQSCESGHYLAYIKSGQDWYKANDSVVTKVSVESVLSQRAYILMYEVAEMREDNGFSHKSLLKKAKLQTAQSFNADPSIDAPPVQIGNDSANGLLSLLCDAAAINDEILNDICCGACFVQDSSSPIAEETEDVEIVLTDDNTIGDSTMDTMESGDTSRRNVMRKSTSSGNLRAMEKEAIHSYRSLLGISPHRTRSRGRSESNRSDPGGRSSARDTGRLVRIRTNSRRRGSDKMKKTFKRDEELPPRAERRGRTPTPRSLS